MPDSSENCCLILNLITLEQTKRGKIYFCVDFSVCNLEKICDERDI